MMKKIISCSPEGDNFTINISKQQINLYHLLSLSLSFEMFIIILNLQIYK